MKVKVENMTSPRSGRPVANQFQIRVDIGVYFQSYSTVIAFIPNDIDLGTAITGHIQLDSNSWDCSVTTSKYRNQFLRETTKDTRAKIDSGEYILTDLN